MLKHQLALLLSLQLKTMEIRGHIEHCNSEDKYQVVATYLVVEKFGYF